MNFYTFNCFTLEIELFVVNHGQLQPRRSPMPAPAQNKNLTTRLDAKTKDEAERLFNDLGMTLSAQ